MQYRFDLKGRRAVVTGAGKGLGKCISLALAQAGCHVAVCGRAAGDLNSCVEEIESIKGHAGAFQMDVSSNASIEKAFSKIEEWCSGVDILINNAGVYNTKSLIDTTEMDWNTVMSTNLKGSFFCCQQAAIRMLREQKGAIVNIASELGLVGLPNRSVYCASKGGIIQLTRALALELAPHNITVNAVAPAAFKSNMTRDLLEDVESYNRVLSQIPLGRLPSQQDITSAVLFLSSNLSMSITGQTLVVDGGLTAR